MQKLKPEDMSLPDRVGVLERGIAKERNRRKLQTERIDQIADYLEVVMNFLDGSRRKCYVFRKKPLVMRAEAAETEDNGIVDV